MVSRLKLSLAALSLIAILQPVRAEPVRAVLELFTSQGCSSCPPADEVLVDLARQPGIVAVSFPVTYWDYLGWKDTLAHTTFTDRQKAYAHGRSDRQVFTPQMIVNGKKSCLGSDRAEIERAIRATSGGRSALPVDLDVQERDGVVTIAVSESPETPQRNAEVWVLPIVRSQIVPIGRGENQGKSVTYANVVRGMKRVGEWSGGAARFEVPVHQARGEADGFVVLLQTMHEAQPSIILGAAKSSGL